MKVVVLVSGGMDSVAALYHAAREHEVVGTLSFDYGSKHNHREIPFARHHAGLLGVPHQVITLGFVNELFSSDLLRSGGQIPDGHYEELTMKATVVPFRNGIMLSIAAGFAESRGAEGLVIAAHSGDHAIYPDCREEFMAPMAEAIRQGTYAGNEVGEVARKIYDPEGSGSFVDREELGYAEAIHRSDVLLGRYEGPIFEVALQGGGVVAFADVMLPAVNQYDEQGWRLIEVKSASSLKDCYRDDLAIQVHLADRMGLPLVSAAIAHIDNTFVYRGDGNYEGLFREVDLLDEDDFPRFEVEEWILEAQDTAELAEEPEIPMGPHCSDPYDCPFAGYCCRDRPQAEFPLSSLPKLSAARRVAIEALGISDLREVPDLLLTDTQNHVREVTLSGQTWFDAEGAAAALSGHGFPAWFLDFETVMMPVPVWMNTRPYQQIPFQFSLHRVEADGAMHHDTFLDVSGADPTRSLAEALIGCVGDEGPVFAYNAGFENRVLRELGQRFPDLATSLTAIAERLVDLHPIAKAHFYAPSQHGSWSLKAVLPAACPDLSYSELDGVADGVAAGEAYREAISPGTTAERRDEIERQLLAYCHLDTLAMVRLWEVFRGKSDTLTASPSK